MKKLTKLLPFCICFLFFQTNAMAQPTFVADEVIVMFEPGTPQALINEFFTDNYLIEIDDVPVLNAYLAQVDPLLGWPTGTTSNNANNPINGIIGGNSTSGVNGLNGLGLNILTNTHTPGFEKGYDNVPHHPLDACGERNYSVDLPIGSAVANNVSGALFDTGVNYHSILEGFFDPQNLGTNFIDPSLEPLDNHNPGHGSHNSSTIAGFTPLIMGSYIDLQAFKTHAKTGYGTIWNIMQGIGYVINQNISVANMSLSFSDRYQHRFDPMAPLRLSIDIARQQSGTLFIAAAGNDDGDNDHLLGFSNYPASYLSDNIISVASINCENEISDFSNHGAYSVDIAAPGENIWGLSASGEFVSISGTSMACAFVSRVALQLGTLQPVFDWEKTKCAIITGSMSETALNGKVLANGYLSAEKAKSALEANCIMPPGGPGHEATQARRKEIKDAYWINGDQINIQMATDQQVSISIFNVLGQRLSSENIQLNEGLNTYDLPWEETNSQNFGTAMYLVNLQYNGQSKTIKIVR